MSDKKTWLYIITNKLNETIYERLEIELETKDTYYQIRYIVRTYTV